MSLFGDASPVETSTMATKSTTSLFEDESGSAPGTKSSLFADDDNGPAGSPWDMPTPRKAARGELIRNLLAGSDVPDSYVDTFDAVLKNDNAGGKAGLAGVTKVLSAGKLAADDQSRVVSLISEEGRLGDLDRNEFNVLLALIGLAQDHEDITLDGVDERRRSETSKSVNVDYLS